jgi:hypothetical protein
MTVKAVCVGINSYPNNPLRGCVHDAIAIAGMIIDARGCELPDVRLCLDGKATAQGMKDRLQWLVSSLRPGDVGIFSNSSHGTQYPSQTGDETDGMDEIICPVDFTFDDDRTWLIDDDIHDILSKKESGTRIMMISDSCHSDDLLRDIAQTPRYIPVPEGTDMRMPVDFHRWSFSRSLGDIPGVVLLSGCKSDQTSADAYIGGEYQGAFTWALLTVLASCNYRYSLRVVMEEVCALLTARGYDQLPQASGDDIMLDQPFPTAR